MHIRDHRRIIKNAIRSSRSFSALSLEWLRKANSLKYCYNFDWMGVPVLQYPQDLIIIQQILNTVRPSFVIETGMAHGGLSVYLASIMLLLDNLYGLPASKKERMCITIDNEIRDYNLNAIKSHPLSKRIQMLEGSSTDTEIFTQVSQIVGQESSLVILDSCKSHSHVLEELNLYSRFVHRNCYIIVMGACIEMLPKGSWPNRPWDVGNSSGTAIQSWIAKNIDFCVDTDITAIHRISSAHNGYLLRCE